LTVRLFNDAVSNAEFIWRRMRWKSHEIYRL
jgi:hypothetical protein